MKNNQKLSPKYWVIHDTEDNGVILETVDHCKMGSFEKFLINHAHSRYEILGWKGDIGFEDWWHEQTRYKCELIEIKLVEMK